MRRATGSCGPRWHPRGLCRSGPACGVVVSEILSRERRGRVRSLDILLAVKEKAEQGAQKVHDAVAGDGLDDVALDLLGTEVGQGAGEGIAESVAKHDNELHERDGRQRELESRGGRGGRGSGRRQTGGQAGGGGATRAASL